MVPFRYWMWFGFDLFGGKQWKASGKPNIMTNRADEDFCYKNNRTFIANILNGSYFLTSENLDYPNGLSFEECFREYGVLYACFVYASAYTSSILLQHLPKY